MFADASETEERFYHRSDKMLRCLYSRALAKIHITFNSTVNVSSRVEGILFQETVTWGVRCF